MDKVKEILGKILEWWNKFTSKQKTAIVAVSAAAVLLIVVVISLLTRDQYILLEQCESPAMSSQIIDVLEGADIRYKTSDDALKVYVVTDQISQARLAIGSIGILSDAYSIDNVSSGGFSTTEADKQRRYVVYLESMLVQDIKGFDAVRGASVRLHIPEQDGTLIAEETPASAAVQLDLNGTFTPENANAMAQYVALALGNDTTENIMITDTEGNLLFSGEEDYSSMGIANNMLQLRQQAEAMVATDVKKVLVGTNQFGNIEVVSRLEIDYNSYEETVHRYYPEDGREEGMIIDQELSEGENTGGIGGVPGTDSNDETTVEWQDSTQNESSETYSHTTYAPNELIRHILTNPGVIDYGDSSVAITLLSYHQVKEEDAKKQGLLDGVSWEEYKVANAADEKIEVDQDLYGIVSKATGISEDKIAIVAYRVNTFVDKEGIRVNWTTVLSAVLLVLILGLLAFVVLHSMKNKAADTEPEELSVENLLQSTPEEPVEDIELETKSETRKMIEKFVDENPEAAANLLRNWLNEDWG